MIGVIFYSENCQSNFFFFSFFHRTLNLGKSFSILNSMRNIQIETQNEIDLLKKEIAELSDQIKKYKALIGGIESKKKYREEKLKQLELEFFRRFFR